MSLDKRRSKDNSTFPVKLIIYFDGDKKRYKTGISLTEDNWIKLNATNLRDEQLRVIKRKLNIYTEKANKVIQSLEDFSYSEFEAGFFDEKAIRRNSNLNELFKEYISFLKENDRIGSALSYGNTIRAINEFRSNLKLTDITKDFLIAFEKYLFAKKLSSATIAIYMRQIRRIVNVAIANGLLPIQKYPFRGYVIPTSRNIKKALNIEQVRMLLNYQTENDCHRKALDFWLFSYVSNGMNMTDICLLKPENLEGDFFSFHRAKTKNMKKKDLRPIKVPLTELNRAVIKKWRSGRIGNPYLFPILEAGLTAWQIKFRIQNFIAFINKHMKLVGEELGIDSKLGTYVARHTHATILKRNGAPTELIKENLGHSSVLTTESYLGDFTDDYKMDFAKYLTQL